MTTATQTHAQIRDEQRALILRALANKGTAHQQSKDGDRIGDHMTAAMALASDISAGTGEVEEIIARLFSGIALGYSDALVAMHARSLVGVLTRDAADLNATAVKNGEPVPVVFKEH